MSCFRKGAQQHSQKNPYLNYKSKQETWNGDYEQTLTKWKGISRLCLFKKKKYSGKVLW